MRDAAYTMSPDRKIVKVRHTSMTAAATRQMPRLDLRRLGEKARTVVTHSGSERKQANMLAPVKRPTGSVSFTPIQSPKADNLARPVLYDCHSNSIGAARNR